MSTVAQLPRRVGVPPSITQIKHANSSKARLVLAKPSNKKKDLDENCMRGTSFVPLWGQIYREEQSRFFHGSCTGKNLKKKIKIPKLFRNFF